jgi:hypothetical protein
VSRSVAAARDSSLDSVDHHEPEKLTSRKISRQEEKKLTKWTPSRNLGNYILCHVRRVSAKADDENDGESDVNSESNAQH